MVAEARLYDATGTLIPLPGPPIPPSPELVPFGIDYEVNDRYRNYPSKNLTPARIERILEAADAGEPFEWVQLCEEMLEKDPKIQSVSGTRKKAVLGINHEIRPANLDDENAADQPLADEIASFCDAALTQAGVKKLIGHLMNSVGMGVAVDWIDWGNDENGKVVPVKFRRIPTGHLRWGYDSDSIRVWSPMHPVVAQTPVGGQLGEVFEPYTTVRALDEERADNPTRGGLLRTCVWYYLFKNTSIKDWVALADRFGTPQRILSLDPNDFTNPELYDKARAALKMIGASASGVISQQWKLDIVAAAAKGGADLYQTIITYIDTAVAQLWLGHELSSQGSRGSGNLGISAANQVRQDYLENDCTALSEVIRRDVLTPMVGWNFGWDKIQLVPDSVFDFEPAKDVVAQAGVLSQVARTFPSLTFSKQQLRDDYGFDSPAGEEAATDGSDDAITAGGSGAPLPGEPFQEAATPDVSINAALSELDEEFQMFMSARSGRKTASQQKLDKLAAAGARRAAAQITSWKRQLQDLVAEGARDGVTFQEMASRLVQAYPRLDVSEIEKALREQITLARLFGRQKPQ